MEIINVNTQLSNVKFNIVDNIEQKELCFKRSEEITNVNVKGKQGNFKYYRKIDFDVEQESYVQIVFNCSVNFEEKISKKDFLAILKNVNNSIYPEIYTKISLIIADITELSILGPIILPPLSLEKTINIKD